MIDSFARRHLWDAGLDYQHGTGHGVGAALNVHEGPHVRLFPSVVFDILFTALSVRGFSLAVKGGIFRRETAIAVNLSLPDAGFLVALPTVNGAHSVSWKYASAASRNATAVCTPSEVHVATRATTATTDGRRGMPCFFAVPEGIKGQKHNPCALFTVSQ